MRLSIHSKFWSGAAFGSRDHRAVFVARSVGSGCVVKTLLTEKWPIPWWLGVMVGRASGSRKLVAIMKYAAAHEL
jgi:hypothetical protein